MTNQAPNDDQITSQYPPQIIDDIMLNLPLKSLIRFKSVSKQWCKQITDPYFARAHLLKHQNNDSSVIFYEYYKFSQSRSRIFIIDVNEEEEEEEDEEGSRGELTLNLPTPWSLQFRCCCDDILCASFDDDISLLLLWNPITNWYKTIPLPPFHKSKFHSVIGIGYDSSTQDYKLVVTHTQAVEVMSLKSNSWRKGRYMFPYAGFYCDGSAAVHLNGMLYWHVSGPNMIISFALKDEKFGQMEVPPTYKVDWFSRLTTLEGKLCMIVGCRMNSTTDMARSRVTKEDSYCVKLFKVPMPLGDKEISKYEIWVMEEESNWVKLFDVPMPLGVPACCTQEATNFNQRIRGIIQQLTISPIGHDWNLIVRSIIGYVGSLVSPLD